MKLWLFLVVALYATNAGAHALHVGDTSITLGETKNTSPALAVSVDNKIYWGALFSDNAAANTLRVRFNGADYWLGEFCSPGTYAPNGINTCIACGIGHYCTGGHHRASCTYGAISCPGTNHATDPAAPAGAPINTLMTLEQVNEFMPVTDISQWTQISKCNKFIHATYAEPESVNNPDNACAHGVIGPGTYLFLSRYPTPGYTDSISGVPGISQAFIAVFDHPVEYRSVHGNNIFQHFVDTNHAQYETWTLTTGGCVGCWTYVNTNATNISNLADTDFDLQLSVYELK